jgi:hypothetical protein
MMCLRYLLVMVILLVCVTSLLLRFDPRFYGLSLLVDLGCILAVFVFALAALIWKKWNAFATFSMLLVVVIVGDCASFAYRLNNVCGPGDHIIQSDADAIEAAQIRIFRARYGSHGIPGYVDEKPGYADFSQADCCIVTRTRTATGVIVWEVDLHGETISEPRKRYVSAEMRLSNCGAVFDEDSFITAEPAR